MDGKIHNSRGLHVGVIRGEEAFDLKGKKLYRVQGSRIYKLSGELVGHLADPRGVEKRLDRATDKLFPE